MTKSIKKRTEARKRVQKRRAALRAMGLRPIQIWVPDTRRKGFAEECRRQCLIIANSEHEKEELAWCEAATAELETLIQEEEKR